MIVSQIAAAAENNVIGNNNELPWNIPEDLKFFRDTTAGGIVIMGRKTYESVGKPLPKRLNIIVTRQPNYSATGAEVVSSLEEAFELAKKHLPQWREEVFVCGGGEIYRQAMPFTDRIYLTRVHQNVEGDATFPEIDLSAFEEVSSQARPGEPAFTFHRYEKKK